MNPRGGAYLSGWVHVIASQVRLFPLNAYPSSQLQSVILVDPADEVELVGQVAHTRSFEGPGGVLSHCPGVHVVNGVHTRLTYADSGSLSYSVAASQDAVAVVHVLSDILVPGSDIYLLSAVAHGVQAMHEVASPRE
jgi:hypothetical protein